MNMNKKILLIIILIMMITPVYSVFAAEEKKVTVDCYCNYEDSNLDCPKECTTDEVEKNLKIECGGRDSNIIGEVKYYCNRQKIFFIPINDSERIGNSPLAACQNYISNATGEISSSLNVTVKAKCVPVRETVGQYICEEKDVLKALTFIGYLLYFVKLLVPFIIILMGTMDYYKAITANKDDSLKVQTQKFIKRIILGIIVFFVPTILNTFMTFLSDYSDTISLYEECVTCALDPLSCDK